jgi:hypothetical protein
MGGVWKTTDRGTTWRHVDVLDNNTPSGPGVIPPYDPDFVRAFGAFFDRADPRRVYVTTSAHGTWVSQRAGDPSAGTGTDWEQLTSLPFLPNQRVTDDPTSGATYVTTFGAGVWRLT